MDMTRLGGLWGGSKRKASVSSGDAPEESETSVLDEEQGSIIMSLISQLKIGMDLSKVTFPTFVLEPRSMLERITDFMSHPELVFGADQEEKAEERFIRVLMYYLSGWHVKPRGVKKPYNPVLGEFFRCRYDYSNGTRGYYIAEQVSHHPPISAYFYISPQNGLRISGELKPKSRFLGNSVSTVMDGENRVYLTRRPEDGEYHISMPNMYARGILFGSMILELGDTSVAINDNTGMSCSVEFKTKGYFSGTYNAIGGRVRKGSTDVGEISGKWSHEMYYTDLASGQRRELFNPEKAPIMPKTCLPEDKQEPNESRRLWSKLTEAIKNKDMEGATNAKSAVETEQRSAAHKRDELGVSFEPRFFKCQPDGRWIPKIHVPEDPKEAEKVVSEWIWGQHEP
ncbi:related to putative oxysterol-binding protein OSBP [Serendipita indica DSM 11827]|uniref:Related to putative oxysterol-binding protein OSBP n=1 Tax=Serendipita indica (strain DSM 11827) TaxID=1109443 RepID=G4TRF7_SERID|nr:related to putative oxysterol-binding protein OSBP [Serendipita indica DSM 11827]